MAGVLVFTESKDGKLKKVSREALSIGRKLAEAAGGDLAALAVDREVAADAGKYGVKQLFVASLEGQRGANTLTQAFGRAMVGRVASDHRLRVRFVVGGHSGGLSLSGFARG